MPWYKRVNGVWATAAPPDPAPVTGRDALVYGAYLPTTTNYDVYSDVYSDVYVEAGTPATAGLLNPSILTEYNSAATATLSLASGTVIEDKIVYGDISVTGAGVATFRNCKLMGGNHIPASQLGILSLRGNLAGFGGTRTGVVTCIDCEITPQYERLNRDCVIGVNFELYRCWIHGGCDGVGIVAEPAKHGDSANVKIMGCVIEDRAYFYPDYQNGVSGATWHTDGTHGDGIQHQGGRNVWVRGNLIRNSGHRGEGTGENPQDPWLTDSGHANGQGVLCNNNINVVDQTVIYELNWLTHGKAHLGIGTALNYVFRNNRHYRSSAYDSAASPFNSQFGYAIRGPAGADVSNITGLQTTNTWVDGPYAGQILTQPRDRGIALDVP